MTCPTYHYCPRADYRMMAACCDCVQDKDCPADCEYKEHEETFWERKENKK